MYVVLKFRCHLSVTSLEPRWDREKDRERDRVRVSGERVHVDVGAVGSCALPGTRPRVNAAIDDRFVADARPPWAIDGAHARRAACCCSPSHTSSPKDSRDASARCTDASLGYCRIVTWLVTDGLCPQRTRTARGSRRSRSCSAPTHPMRISQDRYQSLSIREVIRRFLPTVEEALRVVWSSRLTPTQVQVLTGYDGIASYLHRFSLKDNPGYKKAELEDSRQRAHKQNSESNERIGVFLSALGRAAKSLPGAKYLQEANTYQAKRKKPTVPIDPKTAKTRARKGEVDPPVPVPISTQSHVRGDINVTSHVAEAQLTAALESAEAAIYDNDSQTILRGKMSIIYGGLQCGKWFDGCGKTTWVVKHFELEREVVISTTREAARDLKENPASRLRADACSKVRTMA
ncbi:hypothetical protein EVAR_48928_1 [Eumeta japonica]|uniref:Uncharacterized protein n=1 Tax=Eumeta variegata TaxID=151549 RepID=A0A4C1YXC1_EUMVA|nr:hypothetical protein EVAR_48928_1 [Eumeta japonica]